MPGKSAYKTRTKSRQKREVRSLSGLAILHNLLEEIEAANPKELSTRNLELVGPDEVVILSNLDPILKKILAINQKMTIEIENCEGAAEFSPLGRARIEKLANWLSYKNDILMSLVCWVACEQVGAEKWSEFSSVQIRTDAGGEIVFAGSNKKDSQIVIVPFGAIGDLKPLLEIILRGGGLFPIGGPSRPPRKR